MFVWEFESVGIVKTSRRGREMKLLVISLCTTGIMRDHFIDCVNMFSEKNEVYCITNDNVDANELQAQTNLYIRYRRKEPWSYFSTGKLGKVKRFVEEVKPDLIFVFTPHPVNIPVAYIIRKYTILYFSHDPIPHPGMSGIDKLVRIIQNRIYYKEAAGIVVAGEKLKQQILSVDPGVSREKIHVIPFSLPEGFIQDEVPPAGDEIDLLFFGRIEAYKGLDTLFEAVDLLKKKPIIYIAGKGEITKVFPRIKHIPSCVKILGYVEDARLISYIKKCKAAVFPYSEASGSFVVCQTFYYGKPVIATDVGVFPEYVGTGGIIVEHGNAVKLADAVSLMLENDEIRAEKERNAKRICDDLFMKETVQRKYQVLFEETAGG